MKAPEFVTRFDAAVEGFFDRHLRGRPLVDRAFYSASAIGDFSLIWHLVGAARGVRSDRDADAAIRLSVCLGVESALVNGAVKSLVPRNRPRAARARPLRLRTPKTTSFPSGHASAGFTAATLIADSGGSPVIWYPLAAAVSLSRVHVSIHHASDVVAGAIVGVALGQIAKRVWPLPEPAAVADQESSRHARRSCSPMSSHDFSLTWDYRCPFARLATQHVITGLRAGADWTVAFVPFSQSQSHVEHGETDIWDRPGDDSGLLALQAAVAVRDRQADRFLDVHEGLFEARHGAGRHIRDEAVVRDVLEAAGADADAVFAAIEDGEPLDTVRKEHEAAVRDNDVWGVPTFIAADRAAFVRLMEPPTDVGDAITTVERIVTMLGAWPALNEFKHTSLTM